MRVGSGFDVHAFGPGDVLLLGGVRVPHGHGVVAHSDGDVLLHALVDALLGAAGLGSLGEQFPDDDPAWKGDPGVKAWREFMIKYVPDGDLHDTNYVNAYNSAMVLEAVLKACGDDLSTENILKQAYAIKDLELPMLLPGIKVNTSPTDHVPVDQMQFMRFNGKTWERFGELQTGN